jgi:alpha-tubulin suppressor-like RCC1 family protein
VLTWGRNEHWQLGYDVSGFLNSGQSFDAQPEPHPVHIPQFGQQQAAAESTATTSDASAPAAAQAAAPAAQAGALLYSSDYGAVVVGTDRRTTVIWGFDKHFEPQLLVGTKELSDEIVQVAAGDAHVLLLTKGGAVYTWGRGGRPLRARHSSIAPGRCARARKASALAACACPLVWCACARACAIRCARGRELLRRLLPDLRSRTLTRPTRGAALAGAPIGMPQSERQQWTLAQNTSLAEYKVLSIACGPQTSAAIVA